MADKFEDLRTYVTVISCGGINAAANELGIAKSAVSRRISDLEERLGVTLIERTTRKLEPTAVGLEYYRGARDLLSALERLDADPAGANADEQVSVSAASDVLIHIVAPALAAFRETHPNVTVTLNASETDGDIVVGTAAQPAGAMAIGKVDQILCAAPSYLALRGEPATLADLDGHDAISIDGAEWRFASGASRRPKPGASAPEPSVALALAIGGVGIAQLPHNVAAAALADRSLIALLQDEQPPPATLWVRAAEKASASASHLVDEIARSSKRPR